MNWYDHHARYYDPEVGRWFAIDPALQAASPYMAMGNNPMMMVDEDGEFFLEAMLIGGLLNVLMNSSKIDNLWDGLGYFGVGAAAGALGAGMSGATWSMIQGLGMNGFAMGMAPAVMGIGEGALVGTVAGFSGGLMSGAGNAWIGGASFGEGLQAGLGVGIAGGISGGIMGAATVGVQKLQARRAINQNLELELEDSGVEMKGKRVVATEANAKKFSNAIFGDVEGLDNLYVSRNPNLGKYTLIDGNIKRGKNIIGGVTNLSSKDGNRFTSNVFLSKSSFKSKFKLYLTLGHEYVHVTHNAYPGLRTMFPYLFSAYSEHAAYKWTWEATNKLIRYAPNSFYFDKMNSHSSHFIFDWTAEKIRHHKFISF